MSDSRSTSDVYGHKIPAIVLTGGVSNNFRPLCKGVPKPLLKVGDKTLIYSTLYNIYNSGFRDIRIITNKDSVDAIEEHVKIEFSAMLSVLNNGVTDSLPNITVYGILYEDSHFGTVDIINYISDIVDGDFLMVPCDIYGTFDFGSLLREHLRSKRLCTLTLLEDDTQTVKSRVQVDKLALGGNATTCWNHNYRVMATLDETNNQIIGLAQSISIESGEDYKIFKWHLLRHPHCKIRRDLVDMHIYLFSSDIFKVINNGSFEGSSIRLDLIPYIVNMQETPTILGLINSNEVDGLKIQTTKETAQDEITRVFYFLAKGSNFKCYRVNSIDALYHVNMLECTNRTSKTVNPKLGPKVKSAIIGKNTEVDESANIKLSVIGTNVAIGKRAKITNSVIMDGCKLEEDVVLDRSIVGNSVVIRNNATLKNAIVLSNMDISCNTNIEKDFIPPFIDT